MSYSNYYASSGLFHGSLSSVMGTQFDLLMVGSDATWLQQLWLVVEKEVKRLNSLLNRFDATSEVSFLNQEAGHYPIPVGDELWNILQQCQDFYRLTQGYFDITLQGFNAVVLQHDQTVSFLSDSIQIDLGGYGKGYALAQIRRLLETAGVRQALVNFGNSSILALGTHPCGAYWPIGLENPYTKERVADLKLCDCSLSTSGNLPNHPRHIVNPHTGCFVEEKKMVSVVAKDPIVAEILTTAFMVADEITIESIAAQFEIYEKHIYKL